MAMTNLKLRALGNASGVVTNSSAVRLALDCSGSAREGSNVKMSDFGNEVCVGPRLMDLNENSYESSPYENRTHNAFFIFSGNGSGGLINGLDHTKQSAYASHSGNYTWEEWFNVASDPDHTDEFTIDSGSNESAHGIGASTCSVYLHFVGSDRGPCYIRAKCHDGYNVNATNYNTWLYWEFEIQNFSGRSDERWKQNIEYVGVSNSGLPIYEWDYIDEINAPGRHTGTIAQSLIEHGREDATEKDKNGYYWVDYSKIDIGFRKITDAKIRKR